MSRFNVADVMTVGAVSVTADTAYRDVVQVLERCSVDAVPVVDGHERVLGVVSATDLLWKVEFAGEPDPPGVFKGRRRRGRRRKAAGLRAGDLMSVPAVTVSARTSVPLAARLMDSTDVARLPVVDDLGRLIGMVTRWDLLKVFLRPDEEIRRQVVDEALSVLGYAGCSVGVQVCDGTVTLTGEVDHRSAAERLGAETECVDGVVSVDNRVTWRHDDTGAARRLVRLTRH
jgi:CBS-domain-containing membrane protein